MRIKHINVEPLTTFRYLNAARRGNVPDVDHLPVLHGICDELPDGLSALIATADLQGLEHWDTTEGNTPRLMGEVIPRLLTTKVLLKQNMDPGDVGVLLSGDFYTVPGATKRGGTGDVTAVWRAFADQFRWVAGVAGNHDTFGDNQNTKPSLSANAEFLDERVAISDGLRLAGIGGIIGNPQRFRRWAEDDYCSILDLLLSQACDIAITHDGPDSPLPPQKGSPAIREVVNRRKPPLVIRGHAHWKTPLVELACGTQVLNVDSRVVILTRHTQR